MVTCFPRVTVSLLCQLQAVSNLHVPIYPDQKVKEDEIVTGRATKPRLSGIMFPNINTCENGWSNFFENLIIVALKLLELTRFGSQNQSIYFNIVRCLVSVMMLTFLN